MPLRESRKYRRNADVARAAAGGLRKFSPKGADYFFAAGGLWRWNFSTR
jgi:hypothetical protein